MRKRPLKVREAAPVRVPAVHTATYNATEARREFFTLLEQVARDPSRVVLIEHRSLDRPVMLAGAGYRDYVHQLERLVADLTASASGDPFQLIGSMTPTGDVDDALSHVRALAGQRAAAKLREH